MAVTVFYSWQSDIPNKINRNFIEDALEKAIKRINKNIEVQVREEIEIDKDTKNVPGIPPIVDVIFNKISKCGIFVPDLTFVGETKNNRLLPNPNVLIEYGWALKELSRSRIVPVMNTAFGEPTGETLPFDMRHLRHPLTYCLPEKSSSNERNKAKSSLVGKLANAIELIIKTNLVNESENDSIKYSEVSPTIKPSIFFQPDENILEPGSFQSIGKKKYFPDIPYLFFRLIPSIPLINIKTPKSALDLARSGNLDPMHGHRGCSYGRNKHGAYACCIEDDKILNFTQLFKAGELWGINAYLLDKQRQIKFARVDFGYFPCKAFEEIFINTLTNYLNFASETLKLSMPLRFIAGATDIEGYRMTVQDMFDRFGGSAVDKNIIYKGAISSYDTSPHETLLPFFNYVWEMCGEERPQNL